jgi:hypothetical protein
MLLVLVTWILSSIVFLAHGCLVHRFLKLPQSYPLLYIFINGMFAYTLIIWGIIYFTGFSMILQSAMLFLSLTYLFFQRKKCHFIPSVRAYINNLPLQKKVLYFIILIILLAFTSVTPYYPDNESYYIQTIKWANEQGLIPGLINIHPFLGQFSAWHILQAGTNRLIPWMSLNDLNAYFVFIFILFLPGIQRNKSFLQFIPTILIFILLFTNIPSPELPVILLSLLVFDIFLRNFSKPNDKLWKQMFLLTVFSLIIKLTAVINLILLIISGIKHFAIIKKYRKILFMAPVISLLWLYKNYLLTGYILYPLTSGKNIVKPIWQYPINILNFLNETGRKESYALTFDKHIIRNFISWIFQDGLFHKIINPIMILLVIIFPVILYVKNKKTKVKAEWIIYITGLLYFIFLLFYNPNFRFFLAYMLWLILMIINEFYYRKRIIFNTLGLSVFLIGSIILTKQNGFNPEENFRIPQPVSKLKYRFIHQKTENFDYYYPDNEELFWETGDAPIPAVHHNLLEYFRNNFGFSPKKYQDKIYINIIK